MPYWAQHRLAPPGLCKRWRPRAGPTGNLTTTSCATYPACWNLPPSLGWRAIVVFTNSENGPRIYERVIVAVTGHDHPAFLWI